MTGRTFAVSSTGDIKALLMCLTSVLMGRSLPTAIQIRMEGEFPAFGDFLLEQIAELARMKNVAFSIHTFKGEGVRRGRQWHLLQSATDLVWMGDDDCIYQTMCLNELLKGYRYLLNYRDLDNPAMAYIAGCKIDLNNRRGYTNFDTRVHLAKDLSDGCSFNHLYEYTECTYPRVCTVDTGNALIDRANCHREGVAFTPFEDSVNAGGEDTLFGLLANRNGLEAFFAPNAIAYHLGRSGGTFVSELTTRAEMLLRACDILKIDKDKLRREFGGVFPK